MRISDWSSDVCSSDLVFVTAHEAMMHLARLKASDSVLIHAAAGGVGSAAVQLAYATGATVYATTEGSKLSRVEHLGAEVATDYKTQDFAEVLADNKIRRTACRARVCQYV